MERATQKNRLEFIRLMILHTPDTLAFGKARQAASRLLRYGATYGRIQELWCSGPQLCNGLTLEQYRQIDERYNTVTVPFYERKEARIEKAIRLLCAGIGCEPIFGGDPRGATIKIKMPDGFTNDWGHEGVCVPTS